MSQDSKCLEINLQRPSKENFNVADDTIEFLQMRKINRLNFHSLASLCVEYCWASMYVSLCELYLANCAYCYLLFLYCLETLIVTYLLHNRAKLINLVWKHYVPAIQYRKHANLSNFFSDHYADIFIIYFQTLPWRASEPPALSISA